MVLAGGMAPAEQLSASQSSPIIVSQDPFSMLMRHATASCVSLHCSRQQSRSHAVLVPPGEEDISDLNDVRVPCQRLVVQDLPG